MASVSLDTSSASAPTPEAPHASPDSVIASTTVARTLTISDQHATILLTSTKSASEDPSSSPPPVTRSLLKLTLVPFHKSALSRLVVNKDITTTPLVNDSVDEDTAAKEHSTAILKFLSNLNWRMTSESGAEYSYYEAFLKPGSTTADDGSEPDPKRSKMDTDETTISDTGSCNNATAGLPKWKSFNVELISPASERQIARAMPSPGLAMVLETPAVYESATKPFVDEIRSSGSLAWLDNVVSGRKEKERLLHDADAWILNVDTKWRAHPDALTVPRLEWFQHESIMDLYCLGIIKTKDVSSLRDLTAQHLPTLKEMLETGPAIIESVYGVTRDQLRIFVHYPPQFYHFHVHFTRLENDTGTQVEKAHLLTDVIQNLESDTEYYKKRSIEYKLSKKEKLYHILTAMNAAAAEA